MVPESSVDALHFCVDGRAIVWNKGEMGRKVGLRAVRRHVLVGDREGLVNPRLHLPHPRVVAVVIHADVEEVPPVELADSCNV